MSGHTCTVQSFSKTKVYGKYTRGGKANYLSLAIAAAYNARGIVSRDETGNVSRSTRATQAQRRYLIKGKCLALVLIW
jgi:hypothetical protein